MISRKDKITILAIIILLIVIAKSYAALYPAAVCVADSSGPTMADCNSAVLFPVGNTAQRPESPALGYARINSDTLMQEVYNGSSWTLLPLTKTYTNNASRPIQTVAASANGFQISSSREAHVSYSVAITTTATIGGSSAGYILLEICPTNSSTAGAWQEISRTYNSQTITLAVALQSVQIVGATLTGLIPAGYYTRLRSVDVSGSPSYSYISGQEVY